MGQLLRGSPVLSGEGETFVVRSYFVSSGFTSELVLGMPRADSVPTSKPSRSQGSDLRAVRANARAQLELPALGRRPTARSARRHRGSPRLRPDRPCRRRGRRACHARRRPRRHSVRRPRPAGARLRIAAPGAACGAACCRRRSAPQPGAGPGLQDDGHHRVARRCADQGLRQDHQRADRRGHGQLQRGGDRCQRPRAARSRPGAC